MLARYIAKLQVRVSDKGATAVEYGLFVALIAAVIVATVALLGEAVLAAFETVLAEMP